MERSVMFMKIKTKKMSTCDENGFYYGIKDELFKSILFGNDIELSKWYLSKLLGSDNIAFNSGNTELPMRSKNDKGKRLDIVININDKLVCNIEVNSSYSEVKSTRNFLYLSTLYGDTIEKGLNYRARNGQVIQLNLTRGLPKNKYRNIVNKCMIQTSYGEKYLQDFVIYEYDIDGALKYWYTRNERGIKEYFYLIMLVLGPNELSELAKNRYIDKRDRENILKYRKKLMRMNYITNDKFFTPEQDALFMKNAFISEGIARGEKRGSYRTNCENIKRMLKEKFSIETIAKCLGLKVDEVNAIIKKKKLLK